MVALAIVLLSLTALGTTINSPTLVSASAEEDSWASKAPMPMERAGLRVATINNVMYTIGSGYNGSNEVYNPATDTWTAKASMPYPQSLFAIAACQGKIYCMGGMPMGVSGASDANRVYSPETDSWSTKASVPTARYNLQAQVVDNKIYLIGGSRLLGYDLGSEKLNVTEIYDPATDTWSLGAPLPVLEDYVSAVVNDKIYMIGSTTQIYDPKTDTWSVGASAPEKIIYADSAAAAATTGVMAPKRIYVYDGSSLQIYNPKTDNWTFGTAPPTSRQYLGIGVVEDLLYFIGGFTYTPPGLYTDYTTNEQYTPIGYGTPDPTNQKTPATTNTTQPTPNPQGIWTQKAPMQQARGRLGVATVNGKIYAFGGDIGAMAALSNYDDGGTGAVVNTNEEYDPQTNTWTNKTPMPTPRKYFAIAVYQNKIYCIGGALSNGTITSVNEVYDPALDTWQTKTPMPTPRFRLNANIVNDKMYLISGGISGGESPVNEVYNPQTDSWATKTSTPISIKGYASAVAKNKIYIMGGTTVSGLQYSTNSSNQIYDPEKDCWSIGTPTPVQWRSATSSTINGSQGEKIYVFNWQLNQTITYIYDPINDSWVTGSSMPTARGYSGVAVVNDTIYVVGGIARSPDLRFTSPSTANEQYIPMKYGTPDPTNQTPTAASSASPTFTADPIAVTINADGSVEPASAPIQRDGNTYTLREDVGYVAVWRSNIILDGNHHAILGEVYDAKYNITLGKADGIFLRDVKNVTIKNLVINNHNTYTGISISRSSNITISGNVIVGTDVTFPDMQATAAIYLWETNFSTITNNHIENNIYGICVGEYSEHNHIFENNITGSSRQGLRFYVSSDNCIYHNNFSNNTVDVYDCGPDFGEAVSVNVWNNGKEGNFWSNYNGTDQDGDGIGDAPYDIDANNTDYYPLTAPYGINKVVSVSPTEKTSPTPTTTQTSPSTEQPSASTSASPKPPLSVEGGLVAGVVTVVCTVIAAGLILTRKRKPS
jgi:parallel beta-helix repeat protein